MQLPDGGAVITFSKNLTTDFLTAILHLVKLKTGPVFVAGPGGRDCKSHGARPIVIKKRYGINEKGFGQLPGEP
jgi:hypothetical protein